MAMRTATWAWFSPLARVPWGAPCIFGSIQQARTAAYVPDTPYWSQGRLRPAILVGRQTPSGQKGMPRAAPEHKMTSISATLLSRSGTGRARGAEYSVFARRGRGHIRIRKNIPTFLCNSKWKVCKTPRDSIAAVQIGRGAAAPPPRAQIKQGGDAPNDPSPICKQTRLERHPKIGCTSRV